jgi:AmmeMemoRadiSam system protein B
MKKEYRLRHPVVSGLFYPDRGEELGKEVENYLEKVDRAELLRTVAEQTGFDDPESVQPMAVIAPHAGYMFSGSVQARSYSLLRHGGIETVVIVGPAHQTAFEGVSISKDDAYGTPLGEIEVDRDFVNRIVECGDRFKHFEDAHLGEHAVEVQLPFVQCILPGAKIVPVLVAEQTMENALGLKDAIVAAGKKTGRRTLVVASTDLSHYHSHVDAQTLDHAVIEAVRKVDPDALLASAQEGKAEACGIGALLTALLLSRDEGMRKSAVLMYTDSGEVSGDRRKVVGYLSAILY